MSLSTRPRHGADAEDVQPSREAVLEWLAAAHEADLEGRPDRRQPFPRGKDGMKRRRRDRGSRS